MTTFLETAIMAVFILKTRFYLASLFSASDNLSEYKDGHKEELSIQTYYLHCVSVKSIILLLDAFSVLVVVHPITNGLWIIHLD